MASRCQEALIGATISDGCCPDAIDVQADVYIITETRESAYD
jgi:hypothetical protein